MPRIVGPVDRSQGTAKYRARPGLACTERTLADGSAVIELHGDFDLATAATIKSRLMTLVHTSTHPVVVDMSRLTFLDSVGIAVLVHAWREADMRGVPFGLAAVPAQAQCVLDITRTAALFRIVELDPAGPGRPAKTREP
jgi:anti-anti-sigma factor